MKTGNATAVVRSYAKVNLTLDVLGIRPDGYHAVESVMQSVSLHDVVAVTVGGEPGVHIECDMPGIPTDERNFAYRAAAMFFEDLGTTPRVDIRLEKQIPAQAGLGGGSSNAAMTHIVLYCLLNQCPSAFGCPEFPGHIFRGISEISSDAPFFLRYGTALATGRGEELQGLPDIPTHWMVIVKPPFGVSTPWAYKRLDEMRAEGGRGSCRADVCERNTASARMVKCIQAGGWGAIPGLLSNDLELPAIQQHPGIGELKERLLGVGASGALMCGSGSAVLGLFPDEQTARDAESHLELPDHQTFVVKTNTLRDAVDVWIVP